MNNIESITILKKKKMILMYIEHLYRSYIIFERHININTFRYKY